MIKLCTIPCSHQSNLPLSLRVHTTLLASLGRAMPFSARALKKPVCLDVNIVVKNKSKSGLVWFVFLSTTSTLHYLHNAVRPLSSAIRCFQFSTNFDKNSLVVFDIVVKKIKSNVV